MTTAVFPERRTRSQIKLSDDILAIPEHSPMKNARTALRNERASSEAMSSVQDSEDELLLSPDKQPKARNAKRSVSPPRNDEYNGGSHSNTDSRELKRMKWDLEEEPASPATTRVVNTGHTRTHSDSDASNHKTARKRAKTTVVSNKPNSTSNATPSKPDAPTGVPGKSRAQSVPLFPSSSSMPLLDLRNPPLSPIRARSPPRSSPKHHGLKMHIQDPKERPPSDNDVDETKPSTEIDSSTKPMIDADVLMDSPKIQLVEPNRPSGQTSSGHSPEVPPTPGTVLAAEAGHVTTPMPRIVPLLVPLSPLTPLPDSPAMNVLDGDCFNSRENWGIALTKESDPSIQPLSKFDLGEPKNATSVAPRSQIPRPSMGFPSKFVPPTIDTTTSMEQKQHLLKMAAHKGSSTSGTNAFQLMMKNAKSEGSKDKGKGKAPVSSLLPSSQFKVPNLKRKDKIEGDDKKKVSLKKRMRPKEKKSLPPSRFIPQIYDDEEDDEIEEPIFTDERSPVIDTVPLALGMEEQNVPPTKDRISPSPEQPSIEAPAQTIDQSMPPTYEHVENVTDATSRDPSDGETQEAHEIKQFHGDDVTIQEVNLQDDTVDDAGPRTKMEAAPAETEMGIGPGQKPMSADPVASTVEVGGDALPLAEVSVAEAMQWETPAREVSRPEAREVAQPEAPIVAVALPEVPVVEVVQQKDLKSLVEQEAAEATPECSTPTKTKPGFKKRRLSNIPTSTRITRSALKVPTTVADSITRKPPVVRRHVRGSSEVVSRKSTHKPKTVKKTAESSSMRAQKMTTSMETEIVAEPEDSPARTPSRNFRTPESSPAKISLLKTPSKPDFTTGSPSPSKIARAVSMFSRPTDVFSSDAVVKPNSSSLSTLSSALQKLKMPAPARPNTSLGIYSTADKHDNEDSNDVTIIEGSAQPSAGPFNHRKAPSVTGNSGQSKSLLPQSGPSNSKQRQLSMAMFVSGKPGLKSAKEVALGNAKPAINRTKGKSAFGIRGSRGIFSTVNRRLVQKVSKKTSLPMVEASPVKGGSNDFGDGSIVNDDISAKPNNGSTNMEVNTNVGDVFMVPASKKLDEIDLTVKDSGGKSKDKEKSRDVQSWKDSSRRASLAFSQLSRSLDTVPTSASEEEPMGPPVTPKKLTSTSITNTRPNPSSASKPSPDKAPSSGGTRFSTRQAAKAANAVASGTPDSSAGPSTSARRSAEKKAEKKGGTTSKVPDSLKILKDCVIFVDVRTDDGEEAGSLFVEMLESLGAKILARVGQTCTHVVFKNGLMSTISRYRLLRDPKPAVVGIAWVVDCVEQRRRVEEASYLINLNEVNVAGTNKRRRSMLPKLISRNVTEPETNEIAQGESEDGDISMDGSTSSITLDEGITPLERARRRRSMIFGPSV